ncbi:MAG: TetR/AcrR family transcriptional regulator [Mycobacterium sp.]|nr:TetR/AcrR family transcriptional regulator [Mycobacterium sp.]
MPRGERERLIVEAAIAEFSRATYVGASLAAIAEHADVSKALVISYFGSKEAVYAACVRRIGTQIKDAVAGAMTTEDHLASAGIAAGESVLKGIFTTFEGHPGDWQVLFDRSVPDGPAREAARRERTILREQAFGGVSRSLGAVGLTDPDDLVAATAVWEHTVSALMLWWRRHPDESGAAMVARAHRILVAMGGQPPEGVPTKGV